MKDFTAIDVELANSDPSSICEIGAARFRDCRLIETWRAIVDPLSEFSTAFHSNIHGIRQEHVAGAPRFCDIYETLIRFIDGQVCVAHSNSGFDESCLRAACGKFGLRDITTRAQWYSTIDIGRRLFPAESSYKLEALCKKIGHEYVPHNALEDAMACAALILQEESPALVRGVAGSGGGKDRPRTFRRAPSRKRKRGLAGNPEGPFYRTHIVVTGVLLPPWEDRVTLESHLNELGFVPRASISGKTRILLVGDGPGQKKLEAAKAQGIEIMNEESFWRLVEERKQD